MKATFSFVVVMLLLYNTLQAQQKSGLYLSVNPLSILEPQAAYGAGVGFRFNDYLEISTEYAVFTFKQYV